MNSVELTGRLARDPEVRYAPNGTAVGKFTLAVDRQRTVKEGEASADFISITCFGKTAELVEKYVKKGRLIGVSGRISTGYYEREGKKVYTTDIIAARIEFLGKNPGAQAAQPAVSGNADDIARLRAKEDEQAKAEAAAVAQVNAQTEPEIPEGFQKLTEEDIPF